MEWINKFISMVFGDGGVLTSGTQQASEYMRFEVAADDNVILTMNEDENIHA